MLAVLLNGAWKISASEMSKKLMLPNKLKLRKERRARRMIRLMSQPKHPSPKAPTSPKLPSLNQKSLSILTFQTLMDFKKH